jgi:hypothetical protein
MRFMGTRTLVSYFTIGWYANRRRRIHDRDRSKNKCCIPRTHGVLTGRKEVPGIIAPPSIVNQRRILGPSAASRRRRSKQRINNRRVRCQRRSDSNPEISGKAGAVQDQRSRAARHLRGHLAPDLVSVFGRLSDAAGDRDDSRRLHRRGPRRRLQRAANLLLGDLPSVQPAMATLLIIKFMWSWNEFFWPMVVISSPPMKVVTMGLMSFTKRHCIEYNQLTAAAVIGILLIFVALQRWVVQAVVMSGLKG